MAGTKSLLDMSASERSDYEARDAARYLKAAREALKAGRYLQAESDFRFARASMARAADLARAVYEAIHTAIIVRETSIVLPAGTSNANMSAAIADLFPAPTKEGE